MLRPEELDARIREILHMLETLRQAAAASKYRHVSPALLRCIRFCETELRPLVRTGRLSGPFTE